MKTRVGKTGLRKLVEKYLKKGQPAHSRRLGRRTAWKPSTLRQARYFFEWWMETLNLKKPRDINELFSEIKIRKTYSEFMKDGRMGILMNLRSRLAGFARWLHEQGHLSIPVNLPKVNGKPQRPVKPVIIVPPVGKAVSNDPLAAFACHMAVRFSLSPQQILALSVQRKKKLKDDQGGDLLTAERSGVQLFFQGRKRKKRIILLKAKNDLAVWEKLPEDNREGQVFKGYRDKKTGKIRRMGYLPFYRRVSRFLRASSLGAKSLKELQMRSRRARSRNSAPGPKIRIKEMAFGQSRQGSVDRALFDFGPPWLRDFVFRDASSRDSSGCFGRMGAEK